MNFKKEEKSNALPIGLPNALPKSSFNTYSKHI